MSLSRNKFLVGIGASGLTTASLATVNLEAASAGILAPRRGILVQHYIAPRPTTWSASALLAMQQMGVLSVVEHGYEYHFNGAIAKATTCQKSHIFENSVRPADDCGCATSGNPCYEPGGSDTQGYPTIGSVVANPAPNFFSGAIYIGDFTPFGTHLYFPQTGWGPRYNLPLQLFNVLGFKSRRIPMPS